MTMQWSDIWLLLSIILGGGQSDNGATLESIIRTGDGINHAIFRTEEIASGLHRLTSEKFIFDRNGKYFTTKKANALYDDATSQNTSIHHAWNYIGRKVNAIRYTGSPPNPANIYKYPGINNNSVTLATEQWRQEANELTIKSLQKEHGYTRNEAIESIKESNAWLKKQFLEQAKQ